MKKISFVILLNVLSFFILTQTFIDSSKVDLSDKSKTEKMQQLVDCKWITKNQLDSIYQIDLDNRFGKITEKENEI